MNTLQEIIHPVDPDWIYNGDNAARLRRNGVTIQAYYYSDSLIEIKAHKGGQ